MSTIPPRMIQTIDLYNYTCSDGLLIPAINEYTWSTGVRAFLYFSGLLWCFLGVAIIADVFMSSIEHITSKTSTIYIHDASAPGGVRTLEVKFWNDTVANLSLLALGTSAPECLLPVIEILGHNFVAGEMGLGTIVGTAAYNLLVITAICIVVIPAGEIRRVKSITVFLVMGFMCVFAYVWLALVLLVISPGIVKLWEAIVTLLMFPLLIFVAYLAQRDFHFKGKRVHVKQWPGPIAIETVKRGHKPPSLN
ncbi:sodium/calcium exchanger 2-like [Gigantopelta aegis]|uniref:sodium/calcium exchanger 2-like n=1 Tax=Gigantopelta aegis TaxID=1735272 RepID=UPI001B88BDD6|nr:sodium/calcium exchanger 2-like [Gigantopelta aegis]